MGAYFLAIFCAIAVVALAHESANHDEPTDLLQERAMVDAGTPKLDDNRSKLSHADVAKLHLTIKEKDEKISKLLDHITTADAEPQKIEESNHITQEKEPTLGEKLQADEERNEHANPLSQHARTCEKVTIQTSSPGTGASSAPWAVCPQPLLGEDVGVAVGTGCDIRSTLSGNGAAYTGCQSTTRGGRTCQKWNVQSPHAHSSSADGNYCRNLGHSTIWCYTTDPNTRWEECDDDLNMSNNEKGFLFRTSTRNLMVNNFQQQISHTQAYRMEAIKGWTRSGTNGGEVIPTYAAGEIHTTNEGGVCVGRRGYSPQWMSDGTYRVIVYAKIVCSDNNADWVARKSLRYSFKVDCGDHCYGCYFYSKTAACQNVADSTWTEVDSDNDPIKAAFASM